MDKKLPKVFQNNIGNIKNNENVFHDSNRSFQEFPDVDVRQEINNIFSSPTHVYKTSVSIKTNTNIFDCDIVGRSGNNLITIDNKKINISDIKSIKKRT